VKAMKAMDGSVELPCFRPGATTGGRSTRCSGDGQSGRPRTISPQALCRPGLLTDKAKKTALADFGLTTEFADDRVWLYLCYT
jgi:hypothetical protein